MTNTSKYTVIPENLYLTIQVPIDPKAEVRYARVTPFTGKSSTQNDKANEWAYGSTVDVTINENSDISVTHASKYQKWGAYSHVNAMSIFASNSQPQFIKNEIKCNYELLLEGVDTWFVKSEDNFKFRISVANAKKLIQNCTIVNGIISTPCLWGFYQEIIWLLPITSPEYEVAVKYTKKVNTKVNFDEVAIGDVVDLIDETIPEKNQICTYLGKFWFVLLSANHLRKVDMNVDSLMFHVVHDSAHVFFTKPQMFIVRSPVVSHIVEKSNSPIDQSSFCNKICKGLQNKLTYFHDSVKQLVHVTENPVTQLKVVCTEEPITDNGPIDFENNWPLINRKRIIPIVTVNNEKYIVFKKNKVYGKRAQLINGELCHVPKGKIIKNATILSNLDLSNATYSRLKFTYNDVELPVRNDVISIN